MGQMDKAYNVLNSIELRAKFEVIVCKYLAENTFFSAKYNFLLTKAKHCVFIIAYKKPSFCQSNPNALRCH